MRRRDQSLRMANLKVRKVGPMSWTVDRPWRPRAGVGVGEGEGQRMGGCCACVVGVRYGMVR